MPSILEAQLVRTPSVTMLSFIAPGIPASGGSFSPAAIAASTSSAVFSAISSVRVRYAPIFSSVESMSFINACVSSRADTSPARSIRAISLIFI